jgi:hypothetical protein
MRVRLRKWYEALHFYEAGTTSRTPLSLKEVTPFPDPDGIPYPVPRVHYIISALKAVLHVYYFYLSSVASISTISTPPRSYKHIDTQPPSAASSFLFTKDLLMLCQDANFQHLISLTITSPSRPPNTQPRLYRTTGHHIPNLNSFSSTYACLKPHTRPNPLCRRAFPGLQAIGYLKSLPGLVKACRTGFNAILD